MKVSAYKILLLLLFSCVFELAAKEAVILRKEYVKEIDKSFPLDKNGRVEIANRYGQINIHSWEKETVEINIQIVIHADSKDAANDVFNRVRVDFTSSNNLVTAITQIVNNSPSLWDRLRGFNTGCRDNFKIIYNVKMPSQAFLKTSGIHCNVSCGNHLGESDFYTKHGNVSLGEMGDYCRVETFYGNTSIEALNASGLVQVSYGDLTIEEALNDLDISIKYGDLRLGTMEELKLDSRYTDMYLRSVGDLDFTGSYGDIEIGKVDQIHASSAYLSYDIGSVSKLVDISTTYGDVEVDQLITGFSEARIKGSYSEIKLGVALDAAYKIDARTHYGSINIPSTVSCSRKESKSNVELRKCVKNGKGNAHIILSNAYGDIVVIE